MAVRFAADGQDYTSASSPPTPPFTVTCWVMIAVDRDFYQAFWDSSASAGSYTTLSTDVDGTTLRLFRAGTGGLVGPMLALDVWYRVAVTIDSSGAAILRHGTATGALSTVSGNLGTLGAPTSLRIGESVFGGEWLNGRIANLKHWSAVLTGTEIETELAQYQPARTADLIRWHPFLVAETTDHSGHGRTLSGGVGATAQDGPPIPWAPWPTRVGSVSLTGIAAAGSVTLRGVATAGSVTLT